MKNIKYIVYKDNIFRVGLFFILFFISTLSPTYAQSNKISISVKNASLKEVFQTIQKKSDVRFSYVDDQLDKKKDISINVQDQSIESILDQILPPKGLVYMYTGNTYAIKPKPQTKTGVSRQITGIVKDGSGEALIGASVVVKGTSTGTVTDIDGKFTLAANTGDVLLVSYIGYQTRETGVTDKNVVNIQLNEDSQTIDEVVVVGYGTQKKINLTGSVATVNAEELQKRPISNTTTALQGKVAGLQIIQGTGMPGQESPTIRLRGSSSWGTSTDPLILIDGVVGSLANIPASDIENISVLKDAASASIYGSRASNGVILVTTKKGKSGKPVFSYDTNFGLQTATAKPDQIWNSADYMKLFNKSIDRGTQAGEKYSDGLIAKYSDPNRDKRLYPDFNWSDAVFKTAIQQQHNVSLNGGSEFFTYNTSVGYLEQEGILIGHNYDRYNALVNLESNVNDRIKIGVHGSFNYSNTRMPRENNQSFVLMAQVHAPMYGPFLPDGSGRYTDRLQTPSLGGPANVNRNPFWIADETYTKHNNWQGNLQGYVDVYLLKQEKMKLLWSTKAATRYDDIFKNYLSKDVDTYYWLNDQSSIDLNKDFLSGAPFGAPSKGVQNRDERMLHTTIYSTLAWDWELEDHDLGATLGYSQESYNFRWLEAFRNEFPVSSMEELDGMGQTGWTNKGGYRAWSMRSFFGRLNYAYKSKYLAEINMRYDASSFFQKDNRAGFFPSASLAWRISEENFIKENLTWLSQLKLRGSYGKLGNSNINKDNNYYNWQEVYTTTSYNFGNTLNQAVYMTDFANKNIQWEETTVSDVGFDLNISNGLFMLTADWYSKYTSGILAKASIPASAGMEAPVVNYGELKNYGVEFDLGHQNKIGDVRYGLNAQISVNRNKVMKYPAPDYNDKYIIEEGSAYKDYYLYEYIGVIKTQEEIDAITEWPAGKPQIGDFKLKDQNGDGKINGDDRVRMSGKYPDFLYSFGGNVAWNNWDMSFFFQGVKGQKVWTNFFGMDPFSQGSSPNPKFLDAYDPVSNPNSNIPSIYAWGYSPSTVNSSYHLHDASYIRLKNVQIGYVLPKSLIRKVGIDYLRIYLSGDNLLTFTPYPDLDPERADDGWHTQYPQLKTISAGLNLKF